MKRFLLSVLVVGLLVGQASAAMYVPSVADVRTWTKIGVSAGDTGSINSIINSDGSVVYQDALELSYQDTMSGLVGFVGLLNDKDNNKTAWIEIGKAVTGKYTGLEMYVQNDDQSTWKFGLFANGVMSPLTAMKTNVGQMFTYVFPNELTNPTLGMVVYMDRTLANAPSKGDIYYVSAVPVPAAFLLGMLGLSIAGVKLRKFV